MLHMMLSHWVTTHTCVLKTPLTPHPPQLVNCAIPYRLKERNCSPIPPHPLWYFPWENVTLRHVLSTMSKTDHVGWGEGDSVIVLTLAWWHLLISCHLCNWREATEVRTRGVCSAPKSVKWPKMRKKETIVKSHFNTFWIGESKCTEIWSEKFRIFLIFDKLWGQTDIPG